MIQVALNLEDRQAVELFKQAIAEMLAERNEALYAALAEVVEEIGLAEAIRDGEGSGDASRAEIMALFEGDA
jgi:hypothetical protein